MSSLTIIDHLQPQLPRDILTPSDLGRSKVILVLQCRHSSTGFSIRKLFSEKETSQRLISFLCAKVSFYRQNYENPKWSEQKTAQSKCCSPAVINPSCGATEFLSGGIPTFHSDSKYDRLQSCPGKPNMTNNTFKKNFCCGMTNYSVFASFSCFCFYTKSHKASTNSWPLCIKQLGEGEQEELRRCRVGRWRWKRGGSTTTSSPWGIPPPQRSAHPRPLLSPLQALSTHLSETSKFQAPRARWAQPDSGLGNLTRHLPASLTVVVFMSCCLFVFLSFFLLKGSNVLAQTPLRG